MKATTKIQATRIAEAGARKMTADKYTIKPSAIKALAATMFTVVNLETSKRYTVSIEEGKTFCSCPFFQENKEHAICKHVLPLPRGSGGPRPVGSRGRRLRHLRPLPVAKPGRESRPLPARPTRPHQASNPHPKGHPNRAHHHRHRPRPHAEQPDRAVSAAAQSPAALALRHTSAMASAASLASAGYSSVRPSERHIGPEGRRPSAAA